MPFRWKERNAKSRKDWRCEEENPCQSGEGALACDRQLRMGQWQWTRRDLWQPQKIQRGRRDSRKTNETPRGTRVARRSSDRWPLALIRKVFGWKQKSGISGSRPRPKPTPRKRNSWEVRRGGRWGRRASDRTEERIHGFRVRFRREMSMSLAMPQP